MTDKQLEEAAWDYVAIEIFGDMGRPEDDYAIYIQAFKAGAAYQLKRMRCGECMEATLKISVCCFNDNSVEFTFEDIKTGERAGVQTTLDNETIDKLMKVIWPCSYYGAVRHDKQTEAKED